jgi:hypothetical protein
MRAERRLGELIAVQRDTIGLSQGGRPSQKPHAKTNEVSRVATLKEAGIDDRLADRARKMAAVPEAKFEAAIGEWRERERNGKLATHQIGNWLTVEKTLARPRGVEPLLQD